MDFTRECGSSSVYIRDLLVPGRQMPHLAVKHILSASESEHNYSADNLIRQDVHRPWKGKPGKDSNTVLFQLDKEEVIKNVDIGNEFSAFIEVQVAKSCESNFSVLVPSTSFMDPMECRNEKNGNAVKMFSVDDMNTTIASQKWDVIKIVCKQPFNRRIPFGIAFVRLTGGAEVELPKHNHVKETVPSIEMVLRQNQNNAVTPGSMFARKSFYDDLQRQMENKIKQEEQAASYKVQEKRNEKEKRATHSAKARAVRERKRKMKAVSDEENDSDMEGEFEQHTPKNTKHSKPTREKSPPKTPTTFTLDAKGRPAVSSVDAKIKRAKLVDDLISNRSESAGSPGGKRNEDSSPRVEDLTPNRIPWVESTPNHIPRVDSTPNMDDVEGALHSETFKPSTSTPRDVEDRNEQQTHSRVQKHKKPENGPYANVLSGVVFSLSGFQNPIRSKLRDRAVSLGAKYANDVDETTTHLVAAFKNTPKGKQIGRGVFLVTALWVDRCYFEKRRLDEKLFKFP